MSRYQYWKWAAICAALFVNARAADPHLEPYEPTTFGYTKDSDDVPFFDFKISLKYPLFPELTGEHVYFAFSGRFGQYIGTRDSSPVIGKRFNPKLFVRLPFDSDHRSSYVDIGYAHESNGQKIDTQETYDALAKSEKKAAYAKDYISRGWDYVELTVRNAHRFGMDEQKRFSSYLSLNYYLPHGVLQGDAEEYRAWENDPEGKKRATVNGLRALVKYDRNEDGDNPRDAFTDFKASLLLETGYRDVFKYVTTRVELARKFYKLPVMVWVSSGYNSDLAQYFKRVHSFGVAVDIGSF